jgi:type II secretion system protein N
LVLSDVQGADRAGEKKTLVRCDRVTVHPQLLESLKTQRLQADYRVEIGKGSISGRLWIGFGGGDLHVEGTAQRLNLVDIPWIHHQLGRTLHGLASGRFAGMVSKDDSSPSFEADIRVESGRVGLKHSILSHSELPIAMASVTLQSRGALMQVDKGTVESELLEGRFSGTITLNPNPMFSQIDLQGDVQPKKKFFRAVSNTLAYEAFRLQLKENTLPFRITGTLMEPGIHYGEYAILFQKLEKELR